MIVDATLLFFGGVVCIGLGLSLFIGGAAMWCRDGPNPLPSIALVVFGAILVIFSTASSGDPVNLAALIAGIVP